MITLNQEAPKFKAMAYHDHDFKEIRLDDYKGKFVVLFFYPADFTFVCPTEIEDVANYNDELQQLGVEVLFISTDTHFVHAAWHNSSPRISKITSPLLADPTHTLSKSYEVLRENEGVSDRATFIIDPDQKIKSIEITDEPIGRNAKEMVRKIKALMYARAHPNQACPANWEEGDENLKPGVELVGKL